MVSDITAANAHLERLATEPQVECLGSKVEIGQWFVFRCGLSDYEGYCLGITPLGLWMKFEIDTSLGITRKAFIPYHNISGRIPAPKNYHSNRALRWLVIIIPFAAAIVFSIKV